MAGILENKTAVVYGAAGAIGGAAARAFAMEGARVFLAGPNRDGLERVAADIEPTCGRADANVVDALDEEAIDVHLDEVIAAAGAIDISLNAVGFDEVQGVALVDLGLEDFLFPIVNWSQTVFLTSRAAARRMARAGSGVILTVKPGAEGTALASGFGVASAAVDSISRTLASEVGSAGVRVMILQPNALPESPTLQASFGKYAAGRGITTHEALAEFASTTMLGRLPRLSEFGAVAAFVASDGSSALTGSVIKIDCGSV